jgi:hypothetical protein
MHHGRAFSICTEKGSELPVGDLARKYKGRFVYQGNDVRDEYGNPAFFANLSSCPATLSAAKAVDALGVLPGNDVQQCDAEQAYTQAYLDGVDTFIRIPPQYWPDEWKGVYNDPVCPLILALYGHPDAGGYWEKHCEKHLRAVGFKSIPHWRSCYWHAKWQLLLVVYVDDFKMAGPANNLPPAWKAIRDGIKTDEPGPAGKYLGCDHELLELPAYTISRLQIEMDPDAESLILTNKQRKALLAGNRSAPLETETQSGPCLENDAPEQYRNKTVRAIVYNMTDFLRSCVDRYRELAGPAFQTLRPATTPFVDEDALIRYGVSESRDGHLGPIAAKVLMKCLWAGRMARYDILRPIGALASQITRWTPMDDRKLHRLMCYINSTLDMHMIGWVGDTPAHLGLRCYSDADLAGCKETARSTTGGFVKLWGPTTSFPLDAISKKQTAVSVSTP